MDAVTLLTVGVSWLTSVSVVALVPIDVFTALSGLDKSRHDIATLWSLSYWCAVPACLPACLLCIPSACWKHATGVSEAPNALCSRRAQPGDIYWSRRSHSVPGLRFYVDLELDSPYN